jgi:hypothetical protein
MSGGYSSVPSGFRLNATSVIVGAVLVAVGGLLGATGVLIGGRAVFSATSRWLRELEVPPSEVVRHKWDQTRAAAKASARAWHQHNGTPIRVARP